MEEDGTLASSHGACPSVFRLGKPGKGSWFRQDSFGKVTLGDTDPQKKRFSK